MYRFLRPLAALALAPLAALALGALAPTAVIAAGDQADGATTWMVRPSDGVGEDGRSWVELELDPGETVEEHLLVRNLSSDTVTFQLTAADGYFTDKGRFNMLTADRESTDAGAWIEMQDSVEVASGADAIVPFTLTVPENATPGDHPAGVAAGIRSSSDGEVGVDSRVGFRVMTRVTGELAPSLAAAVSGNFAGSINPFEPGSITMSYDVTNTGNTRLAVDPTVTVSGPFGWLSREVVSEPITEMAPGETRTSSYEVRGVWPLFAALVGVEVQATAVADGLEFGAPPAVTSGTTIPAIPWSQLVVLALLIVLVVWSRWGRRRKARQTEELIDRVRAETRAEAVTLSVDSATA